MSLIINFLVALAIELNPDYVRALLRRAELYEQTEKLDEALEDYKKVLDHDPNQASAREACMVSSLTAWLKRLRFFFCWGQHELEALYFFKPTLTCSKLFLRNSDF